MNKLIKAVPSILTYGNLCAGCFGLACVYSGSYGIAGIMIIVAAVFDFFDGFTARALKAQSEFGAQLDSLADMLSFGILPAFIAFDLANKVGYDERWVLMYTTEGFKSVTMLAGVYVIAAATRLAIFNSSTDQKTTFKGMPSPAGALFVAGFPLVYAYGMLDSPLGLETTEQLYTSAAFPLFGTLIMGVLMVIPIPFFSLKFKGFALKNNVLAYSFLLISLVIILLFKLMALQVIILLYIVIALVKSVLKK